MKHRSDRWSISNVALIPLLAITLLLLSGPTLSAQEIIDPRSGQLFLSVTDLTVQAGPVSLEVRRSLETGQRPPGLLGTRWRLNWESRAVSTPTVVVIDEAPYAVAFTRSGGTPEYQSVTGDRLILQGDGRFVRTRMSGTTETFDVQGRLIERDYRNGNKAIVRYGADGRIARIDGPRGSFIQFSAVTQGRVTRIETSTGASVRYAYIGDNLTEIQVNGGPVVRYAYDPSGALTRIEKPRSGAVELAYDAHQRVVSRRWADGAEERFEYDDAAREQRRIDPIGAVTVTRFDQDGRRAEVIEPRGGKGIIAFDAAGRPESVTDQTGASTKLVYDPLGRAAALQDAYGQITRYEYVGATGRVRTITRADGTQESLAYDPQQNVTEIRLGAQTLVNLAYNPDGTVSVAKVRGLAEHRLTYDGQARLQTLTNPLGERLQLSYDARGNPVRAIDAIGGAWAWQWNAQDRLVSETDPVGGITRYEYDSSGRLARAIDPLGRAIRFEYDVRGRRVAETDPSGQVTRYEYDRAGRLVKLSERGVSESFGYDAAGNLIEWVDRLGRMVQLEYDALGRVTQERWSTGLQVHYRYDARGQVTGIGDSAGRKLEWQHDQRGQIIAQRDALGAITKFQYDALGNVTGRRDPRGHLKQFAYTADGALASVQEPSGDAAEYRYDAAHRLVEMVRPSGGTTRFNYNGIGKLTQEIDPLGHERSYQYDVAGRLVASTDAMRRTTRYAYDAAGRLTEKRFADGKRATFKYDASGNLVEAHDGVFPVRYKYDAAGRRVKAEYPTIKKAVAYEYDAAGLRKKLIGPDRRVTRYEYDGHKQLAAIIPPDGKPIALGYDAQQRLQSIRYPNGLIGTWEYDTAGRVTKLAYVHGSGKPISAWTYHYDPDGNLVRQKDTEGRDTTYSYDPAGQLTEVAGSAGVVRYRYGRGGARAALGAGPNIVNYRHDAADRLIEAGSEKLSYDANGNLVRREGPTGTTSYEYDPEDRLVKVQASDRKTTTFGYAPTGERVWKRDEGGLTYYIYDGIDLIEEIDEKGNLKTAYAHGPGLDQPLTMLREGKAYYYHADRLGSTRALTDEHGNVVAAYDYDAHGKIDMTRGGVSNPFTFTGREWDASTRLYYYRTRYYDPALGQFLSPDWRPARLNQPLEHNPYLYVRNQPLRFVDPLGLAENNPYLGASTDELLQRKGILDAKLQRTRAAQSTLIDRPNEIFANTPREDPGPMRGRYGTFDKARSDRLDRIEAKIDAARQPIQAELNARGYVPPAPPAEPELTASERRWLNRWLTDQGEAPLPSSSSARATGKVQAITPETAQVPRPVVPTEGSVAVAEAEAGAALAEAEAGALARLKGVLPSKGTVAIIAVPAIASAINEAAWAEPGKGLEAAGESLGQTGHGLWESGKKIGGCAAIGAFIGGCIGNVPGAIVGAKIGAAVPVAVDTIKTLVQIPQDIRDLKDRAKRREENENVPLPGDKEGPGKPSGEGPAPSTDRPPGSLVGSVTGGLPGAPDGSEILDLSDIPFDPRTAPRLPHPLPEHIARAGEQKYGGGIPTQGATSGGTGGTVIKQPGLTPPPVGPGQTTTADPPPPPYPYPGSPGYPPSAGSSFAPPGKGGPSVQTPWEGVVPGRKPTPGSKPGMTAGGPPQSPQTPGPGAQGVDLSGTWHATYQAPFLGNLRFTMTLSRVAAGKWQGPLDYVVVDCPEMSFKTPATLQATGVGKVRLTYNTPAKDCPRYVGKIGAGAQQADGTYANSQITFGVSPNTVTYTRK